MKLIKKVEFWKHTSLVGIICVIIIVASLGLWINFFFISLSRAATTTWTFEIPGNYTYDSTRIDIFGGISALKSIDQTDDDNISSGFGGGSHSNTVWDASNSAVTLAEGVFSGTFLSRIIDATTSTSWTTLTPTPKAPYGKELPANAGVETAYTEGNVDMSGNVLLLHLNESSWSGSNGEVIDSSGQNNNGTSGGGANTTETARFNRAGNFDGIDDYVEVADAASLDFGAGEFSIELWVKTSHNGLNTVIGKHNSYLAPVSGVGDRSGFSLHATALANNFWRMYISGATCAYLLDTDANLSDNNWHHYVFVKSNTAPTCYVDGAQCTKSIQYASGCELANQSPNVGSIDNDVPVSIMKGLGYTDGAVDEVALYNRALSANEVMGRYRRGAINVKYQARSCDDNGCSGENFVGPSGNASAYYTEITNSAVGLPSFTLSGIDNNRYVQYSALLETASTTLRPKISSIIIAPTHYYANAPTIIPTASQGFTYTLPLETFVPSESGNGDIFYQITRNATSSNPTWYFWNGSVWSVAGDSDYNSSSTINANLASFSASVGTGSLAWRSFFISAGGVTRPSLSQVAVGYTVYAPANLPINLVASANSTSQINLTWSANSNPTSTEYYAENIIKGTNSGWITALSWDSGDLACGTTYTFRVKARNSGNVETAFVESVNAITHGCGGGSGSLAPITPPAVNPPTTSLSLIMPAEGSLITDLPFMVRGYGASGVDIEIKIAGSTYKVKSGETGEFSLLILDQLTDGNYVVNLTQMGATGKTSSSVERKILVATKKLKEIKTEPSTIKSKEFKGELETITPERLQISTKPSTDADAPTKVEKIVPKSGSKIIPAPVSTASEVKALLEDIKKREAFLVVMTNNLTHFNRNQLERIEVAEGEEVNIFIRPAAKVYSITARIYRKSEQATEVRPENLSMLKRIRSWLIPAARAVGISPAAQWLSGYIFNPIIDSRLYRGSISLANVRVGDYELVITFNNQDGSRLRLTKEITVKTKGKIMEKKGDEEEPITFARVVVFKQTKTGDFVSWDGWLYGAENPIFTDQSGEYILSLPPGIYYLRVDAAKYETYHSGIYVLDQPTIIREDIYLEQTSRNAWDRFWEWLKK